MEVVWLQHCKKANLIKLIKVFFFPTRNEKIKGRPYRFCKELRQRYVFLIATVNELI